MLRCSGYSQANTVIGAKTQMHVIKTRFRVVVWLRQRFLCLCEMWPCIGFKSSDGHGDNRKVSRAVLSAADRRREIIPPTTSRRLRVRSLLLVCTLVTTGMPAQRNDTIPPMDVSAIALSRCAQPQSVETDSNLRLIERERFRRISLHSAAGNGQLPIAATSTDYCAAPPVAEIPTTTCVPLLNWISCFAPSRMLEA